VQRTSTKLQPKPAMVSIQSLFVYYIFTMKQLSQCFSVFSWYKPKLFWKTVCKNDSDPNKFEMEYWSVHNGNIQMMKHFIW